ncbi:hypothetical protein K2W90_04850 [Candidatus Babeliales bacterium]|nr:hypothetical protein [Candidatus Babeliales bacterium]
MKIAKLWLVVGLLVLGAQGIVFGAASNQDQLGSALCSEIDSVLSPDMEVVKTLIEQVADLNNEYSWHSWTKAFFLKKDTPLGVAVKKNRLDIVRLLLAAGADPRLAISDGSGDVLHALQDANNDVWLKGRELCEKLVKLRDDLDRKVESDLQAFQDFLKTVPKESLFKKYTFSYAFTTYKDCTPLAFALELALEEDIAKQLVDAGGGVIPDLLHKEYSPAVNDGKLTLSKAPIRYTFIKELLGKELLIALKAKDQNRAKELIQAGANVNIKSEDAGSTPLHLWATHSMFPRNRAGHKEWLNSHQEIVELLLAAGADPGVKDSAGNTPLEKADDKDKDMLKKALEKVKKRIRPSVQTAPTLPVSSAASLNDLSAALQVLKAKLVTLVQQLATL